MIAFIFAISINAQAESFKLVNVKMGKPNPQFPPATIKNTKH